MKIYILTDLEGVAGVGRWDQTGADTPGYPQAVRLMTEELRACVAGIQSVAPDADIWVWDARRGDRFRTIPTRRPPAQQLPQRSADIPGRYFDAVLPGAARPRARVTPTWPSYSSAHISISKSTASNG